MIATVPGIRSILRADAIVAGATGLLMLGAASALHDGLSLPSPLLRGAGLILIPYVAYLWWLTARRKTPAQSTWSVIAANIGWAVGCIGLLISGLIDPNVLGTTFILIQAVVVLVFADLQFLALRDGRVNRRTSTHGAEA